LLNFTNPIFLIYNASRAASRRCPQAPSFTRVASADRFSARRSSRGWLAQTRVRHSRHGTLCICAR
jgi:hypothetical protein